MHILPSKMKAILTEGIGGYEKLKYCDVDVPKISSNEVLVRVLAAGINNTDINTRIGWYDTQVNSDTESLVLSSPQKDGSQKGLGWNGTTNFPLIQGTDCCGEVVSTGSKVRNYLLGKRVIIRPCVKRRKADTTQSIWMASDFNGAFSEFVKVPEEDVFVVKSNWTDCELATIPCAYGTAENMLYQSRCDSKMKVLVTGASGNVGYAAIQLAINRGADVSIVTSAGKQDFFNKFPLSHIAIGINQSLEAFGERYFDLIVDPVGGKDFPFLLKLLKKMGTYISSGAIAGPIVSLDLRDLYLKDLKILGTTAWSDDIFPNLITYIENNEIVPVVAKKFPLCDIVNAQKEFLKKKHLGKFVLIP